MERLRESFPIPIFMDNALTGFMFRFLPYIRENYYRNYHAKIDLYDKISQRYGKKIDTIQVVTQPTIVNAISTRDPVVVKHILKDDFDSIIKPLKMRSILNDFIGRGIFNLSHGSTSKDHELWTFQRKTAAKIFTKKTFNGHVYSVLLENVDKFIAILNDRLCDNKCEGVIPMKKLFYEFTLDAIGAIGFGVSLNTLGSRRVVPFAEAFDGMLHANSKRWRTPYWSIAGRLLESERDIVRHKKVLDKLAVDIISERRNSNDIESKGDILSLFMTSNTKLSNKLLRDIIMSFLLAGRDTSACTLSAVFYLIATHPQVQSKLYSEIKNHFNVVGIDKRTTLDMLKQMPYLAGVILEALRLFPPVPVDIKEAGRDTIMPTGEKLPRGTIFLYEVFVMGRDPTRYSDPGMFKPERWLNKNCPLSYNEFEFPVFQAGNRFCIGKELAVFEIKVLVVELLRRFEFGWHSDNTVFDESDVSLVDGVPIYKPAMTLSLVGTLPLRVSTRKIF